jgi:hypothetical protein
MGKFKITALDHIVLNVGDIDRALQFYTGVLGLAGERVEQFRAGKVGFPSVRINDATIIDLFPRKTPDGRPLAKSRWQPQSSLSGRRCRRFSRRRRRLEGKSNCYSRGPGIALGRAGAGNLGLFSRSRWQ